MKKNLDKLINNYIDKINITKDIAEINKEEHEREKKRFNENSNKQIINKIFGKSKKNYISTRANGEVYDINNLKIIGITGTFGKSSVAVLIHRYLQSIGKKSVLYSSAYIDSPASWLNRKVGYQPSMVDEEFLSNILNECKVYETEYLILECWDGAISRGAFDNIDFDLKVLTSFMSNNASSVFKDKEQYFNIKLKFLTATDDCPVLINMRTGSFTEDIHKRRTFINKINSKKLYYSILPTCAQELEDIKLDYYLEPTDMLGDGKLRGAYQTIDYSIVNIKSPNKEPRMYKSPLIGFNIDNSLCAYAIADFFGELDQEAWAEFIESEDLYIAGRTEKINWKDRTIIISPDQLNICLLANDLRRFANNYYENNYEYYYKNEPLKAPRKINNIITTISPVSGSVSNTSGSDYYKKHYALSSTNIPEVNINNAISAQSKVVFNNYVDFGVLNVIDLGDGDYDQIIEVMKSNLTIPTDSAKNRYDAIVKALMKSEKNDIIIISGRGNLHRNKVTYDKVEFGTDREFIDKACEELYWLE